MRPTWTQHKIGVFRSLVLLVLLSGLSVSAVAIFILRFDPLDVAPAALLLMAAALAVLMVLYTVGRMIMGWFRRTSTDRILIGHMASLLRQKLPLAQGLALAAASERGLARSHLRRIAASLAVGHRLSDAIRFGWPDCPGLVLSLIMAGEKSGQLTLAVEQAEQYVVRQNRWRGGVDTPVIPYAIVISAATALMVSGIMVAVIPKYKEIFKDFETRLPTMTCNLIAISEWLVSGAPPGWVLLVPVAVALVWLGYLRFRPRRVPEPQLTACMADWLRWHMPGLHKLEWSRGMAAGLRAMSLGLRAGMGLSESAWLASGLDVNVHLRARLEQFAELIETGSGLREAADRAGLGRLTGLALESGLRAKDMDAAIRYAADYHEALISRWWLVFRSMAWPLTTLCLGTMVAFVVVSLFVPLVALINSTARVMP